MEFMENNKIKTNFTISYDADFISKIYDTTPAQEKFLKEIVNRIHGKIDKAFIRKIDKLCKENPNLPQLRNYLTVAYKEIGQYDKAVKINEELLKDFPNYLHARLNAANFCFYQGKPEEALEYLGNNLDLKELYPERDEFHFSEVQSFYYTTVLYAIAKEDLVLAENRFEFYKSLDEENPRIYELNNQIMNLRGMLRIKRREELNEVFGDFNGLPIPEIQDVQLPMFYHEEIWRLYEVGFSNSIEKIQDLLLLPRKTLIEDLELVLQDAVSRYNELSEEGWDLKLHSFLLHTLFLLREIHSEESLAKIKEVLSYDKEMIEFYFGDDLCEIVWLVLFDLGKNKLSELEEYLYRSEVHTFTKTEFAVALVQLAIHYPEKQPEIIQIFKRLFEFLLDDTIENRPIDPTFLGLAISDLVYFSLDDVVPLIKELFDRGYVDLDIMGDWKEFEVIYNEKSDVKEEIGREIKTIEEVYSISYQDWDEEEYFENSDFDYGVEERMEQVLYPKQTPVISNKIGRNDPCVCGSGKKYKKCCGN